MSVFDINQIPASWGVAVLPDLIGVGGLITDGDWVESKDQDPDGGIRLTQLADVGVTFFRDRSARFLTAAKVDELSCTILEADDVLVARMPDPLGRACLFPLQNMPCVTVVDVCIIRPKTVSHPWLMYIINAPAFEIAVAGLQSGSTRKRISKKNLCTIRFPVPPLPEQHRIVEAIESYLTRLDDAVATLERVQRNLKRYRASVLKTAVEGRLVPTEAELARQENRDYEPASVLLERILKERKHRFIEDAAEKGRAKAEAKAKGAGKPWTKAVNEKTLTAERTKAAKKYKEPVAPDTSKLSELPEGWCWTTLDMLAHVGTGATPKRGNTRFWKDGNVAWVTSAVAGMEMVTEPSEFVTEAALKETNLTLYPAGTLVVAMYGEGKTRGKCAELAIEATTNQALAALVTTGTSANVRSWIKLFMDFNYDNVRRKASGGVQPNLNLGIVREIPVPLPPMPEQRNVVAEVERLLSVAAATENAAHLSELRSKRLRQSILKWAFEGKLVDQDPTDEPASDLLERIKAERATNESTKKTTGRGRKRRTA